VPPLATWPSRKRSGSPHWGKVFDPAQFDFPALYPRLGDAQHAFAACDPTGVFRNVWFDMTFG